MAAHSEATENAAVKEGARVKFIAVVQRACGCLAEVHIQPEIKRRSESALKTP